MTPLMNRFQSNMEREQDVRSAICQDITNREMIALTLLFRRHKRMALNK